MLENVNHSAENEKIESSKLNMTIFEIAKNLLYSNFFHKIFWTGLF